MSATKRRTGSPRRRATNDLAHFLLIFLRSRNSRRMSRCILFTSGGRSGEEIKAEIKPMAVSYARPSIFAVATALLLSSSTLGVAFDDEDDAPYRGLGAESCRQYLKDVANDQTAQQLYSAWLSGYVTIAYAQFTVPQFVEDATELHAANDWIKGYCSKRASDTVLAATVSLLMARERNLR